MTCLNAEEEEKKSQSEYGSTSYKMQYICTSLAVFIVIK